MSSPRRTTSRRARTSPRPKTRRAGKSEDTPRGKGRDDKPDGKSPGQGARQERRHRQQRQGPRQDAGVRAPANDGGRLTGAVDHGRLSGPGPTTARGGWYGFVPLYGSLAVPPPRGRSLAALPGAVRARHANQNEWGALQPAASTCGARPQSDLAVGVEIRVPRAQLAHQAEGVARARAVAGGARSAPCPAQRPSGRSPARPARGPVRRSAGRAGPARRRAGSPPGIVSHSKRGGVGRGHGASATSRMVSAWARNHSPALSMKLRARSASTACSRAPGPAVELGQIR